MIDITNLSHSGLLCISGEGAKKFLQGQLTCNVEELTPMQPALAAHCNPQGRIISLFKIILAKDQYFLSMPTSLVPIALRGLQKYAVFFKVNLEDVSQSLPSHRTEELKENDIAQGIAAIYPETSEMFLPHDLNLPQLNAVSFNKGCYTGQEIIARMHYRGKPKTHLYRARVNTELTLQRGNDIYVDGKRGATLVDFYQHPNHNYDVLIISNETDAHSNKLSIDPEKKAILMYCPFDQKS